MAEEERRYPYTEPVMNMIATSLRTHEGYQYINDNYAFGSVTTTVNATVTSSVTLGQPPRFKTQIWPGAAMVYLLINTFFIVPTAVPTANAGLVCSFIDLGGNATPLGGFLAQSGGIVHPRLISLTPITDTNPTQIGTLLVNLANVTSSNGTYNWQMGLSYVYVIPTQEGYKVITQEQHRYGMEHVMDPDVQEDLSSGKVIVGYEPRIR